MISFLALISQPLGIFEELNLAFLQSIFSQ